MNKKKTVLCVNGDASYVVFTDYGMEEYSIVYYPEDGVWWQHGVVCHSGVKIPESCLATRFSDLAPGDGPIELTESRF